MYASAYSEFDDVSQSECAGRERQLLEQANHMLRAVAGERSVNLQVTEAVNYTLKIWQGLAESILAPGNALAAETKQHLISISLWMWQSCNEILAGNFGQIPKMLEINSEIADGLRMVEEAA